MTTDGADYCMLIDEWVWSKSRVCLLRLEVDIDSVLESELGQKWVKCICTLKAISSEQKVGFKGFLIKFIKFNTASVTGNVLLI